MTIAFFKKYCRKYALILFVGILATMSVDAVQLFIPEFLGELVEKVSSNSNLQISDIKNIVIDVLVISLVLFFGRILWRFCILSTSGKIEKDLRSEMFLKAERLSQRYYHCHKVGDIMSWFASDIEAIEEFIGWGMVMIVDAVFLTALTLYKMLKLDLLLCIISMIPLLTLIVWGNRVEKTMSDKWEERQKVFDKLYDYTHETFAGIRVIKAFVKEKQEKKGFEKVASLNSDKNLEFAKCSIKFDIYIELIIGIMMAALMASGSYFVYRNSIGSPFTLFSYSVDINAGKLITFIGYVDTMIWPMIAMGQILQMHSRFLTSYKRIKDFLDEEEEIRDKENPIILDNVKGNIRFNHFSFVYPASDKEVLDDITLEIKAGELIGVVGKIGSGKTTLVNSLLRLYNVEANSIFIDDTDIMDMSMKNVRDNIAYVPQDNFLFSDNIKNNIAFSNKKMKNDDIKSAAEFADVDGNIASFKEGYETMTGERGVTLSGGQKQRISIARAYVKDAPIMILDDSVSAVDVKTEETILNNIYEKRKGKTTIIIASRVSTVSHLDKIIVLNDGKVEAFDTPSNLLMTSPTYKKMVYLQKLESEL